MSKTKVYHHESHQKLSGVGTSIKTMFECYRDFLSKRRVWVAQFPNYFTTILKKQDTTPSPKF
ncbi:hypothetical protein HF325_003621 [Metschnikowia pulcherrima]|uniref:Uncharacterized protein n=1 Tax=Metschnikowia pulcherrima TaxID=27326 RepID=A0A8H7GU18_9ASCO|nr:hypothetical protein HF325_003621 [Metschnikowia pulcherrima]